MEVAPREQGDFAYCIQGAIAEASGSTPVHTEAMLRVEDIVGGIGIPSFNDRPETTQGDVLDVMNRAISAEWNGDPIGNGSINLIYPYATSGPPFPPAA
jgi:hypothetical protein